MVIVIFHHDPVAWHGADLCKIWHECHLCNDGGHRDKMHCKNPKHLQLSEIKDNTSRRSTAFNMTEPAFKDGNMQVVAVLQRRHHQTSFHNPNVELGFPVGDVVRMTKRVGEDFRKNQTTLEDPLLRKTLLILLTRSMEEESRDETVPEMSWSINKVSVGAGSAKKLAVRLKFAKVEFVSSMEPRNLFAKKLAASL
jgi:hypothetical protein